MQLRNLRKQLSVLTKQHTPTAYARVLLCSVMQASGLIARRKATAPRGHGIETEAPDGRTAYAGDVVCCLLDGRAGAPAAVMPSRYLQEGKWRGQQHKRS